jgi:hypothetical protein
VNYISALWHHGSERSPYHQPRPKADISDEIIGHVAIDSLMAEDCPKNPDFPEE